MKMKKLPSDANSEKGMPAREGIPLKQPGGWNPHGRCRQTFPGKEG
jgi:hypothetical protein